SSSSSSFSPPIDTLHQKRKKVMAIRYEFQNRVKDGKLEMQRREKERSDNLLMRRRLVNQKRDT
uniref:hypothetical protein n=1 Tax=Candidatus Cardinium sp. cBcalN2 TaxID=2699436 RepID=UPI001FB541E6